MGVRRFALHAGEVFAGAHLVDAGLFHGEVRIGGVGPPGNVAPGEGEDDRRLVAVA
jgi:hypothetical protein